jgi:phage-related tail protein
MAFSKFFKKIAGLFGANTEKTADIDAEGFMSDVEEKEKTENQDKHVVVKASKPDKAQTLERLEAGFSRLIDQLEGINGHLDEQARQNENLLIKLDKLPELLASLPQVVDNQNRLTEKLSEDLKNKSANDQMLREAVEKIPNETAKQTEALGDINEMLTQAKDTDTQLAEDFGKFNSALEKLDENTANQSQSISQMSKTFATSDRYLKYLITRQNRRFMWLFAACIVICVTVIVTFVGIIIYLAR